MHPISPSIALWALSLCLLPAADNRLLDPALLGELRSEAARSHPAAVAGRHEAQAAAHEVRAVRLWMDPMVDIGFMAASKMMRIEEGDTMIGFEQPLPRPGMYAAERSKMEAMQRASSMNAEAAANLAGALATKAAIELALADESIALGEARLAWMNEIAVNARQMAADPMGGSADALRMETELAMERQMLDAARRNRERYAIQLNLALGRAADSPWPALKLPDTPPPAPVVQAEVARVAHANPKVRAMHEMVGAAEAEVRLARSERLPEVAVGVNSQLYSATGDIRNTVVGIKLSLPWFNDPAYQSQIDAARSRKDAAQAQVETMRREMASMVAMLATEAANAAAQARAYGGDVRNKAQLATESTKAAWVSSKATLSDVLDATRSLYAVRLEERRMLAMQLAALEDLEALVPARPARPTR